MTFGWIYVYDSFEIAQISPKWFKIDQKREIFEKSIIPRQETRKNSFLVPRFSAEKFATLVLLHVFTIKISWKVKIAESEYNWQNFFCQLFI